MLHRRTKFPRHPLPCGGMSIRELQGASDVLMIRPVNFAGNPQTRASNRFQSEAPHVAPQAAAAREFDGLAEALSGAGVNVHTFADTPEPHTPDSIFPNNWVSFHADGTVVLYPMLAENRRQERRNDLLERLSVELGFRITRILDMTAHERDGKFLEGTGSLVLDRVNRIAYACISPRTDVDVLGDFAQQLDYDVVAFEAQDRGGTAIYHTNVLMCVGTGFAAVCSACIREDERAAVVGALRTTGHEIVELSLEQLAEFAGNMLELRSALGETVIAMSQRALDSLSPQQRSTLGRSGTLIAAAIPTIETLGGGSVRCMLAEIHLPKKGR
jgi:hypothetical protein